MFEPLTLSVAELAERWNRTPRQILESAEYRGLPPLYFTFEGLAFDVSNEWLRSNGDYFQSRELEALKTGIAHSEAWIRRSARGETGEWDRLSDERRKELRTTIEADKRECAALVELLEQRERDRNKMFYRGLMRAAPKTLLDIAQHGTTPAPHKAFHPQTPLKTAMLPGGPDGEFPIWDGRLMDLESLPGCEALPLTIESLCAATVEVKAIEAYLRSKQSAPEPQAGEPAAASETKEQREDRRLQRCIDAGLPMDDKAALLRLPDGVGDVADSEDVSRQAFSKDVKAALARREIARREGATLPRA